MQGIRQRVARLEKEDCVIIVKALSRKGRRTMVASRSAGSEDLIVRVFIMNFHSLLCVVFRCLLLTSDLAAS